MQQYNARTPLRLASALAMAFLTFSIASAQKTGEEVKDTDHGLSFKAPDEWVSIPVDPLDSLTLHKYQAEKADAAKKHFGLTMNASMRLLFFPVQGTATPKEEEGQEKGEGEEEKRGPPMPDPVKDYTEYIDRVLKKQWNVEVKGKPSSKKIRGMPVVFYDLVGHIPLRGGENIPIRFRSAVFNFAEGEYVMEYHCMEEHFKKRHSRKIESSIRSFKRIEKEDEGEGEKALALLSDNERYIQEQIDKLSSGWYYFWSSENNYMIFSNADRSFAKEIARHLEGIHACYVEAFPGEPRIRWTPIVRVCKTKDEYHGYGGPSGSAGYWSDLTKEFVFYNDVAQGPKNTFLVLKHEAFHHFIHFYLGCRPSTWFDEGMAEYFAGGVFVGKRVKIKVNPWRRSVIKDAIVREKHVPLKLFVNMSKQEYYAQANLCYAQGWAFVYYLLEGRNEGAKIKKEWSEIPQRYLENLQAAFAKLEQEQPDKVAPKDEVNNELSSEAAAIAMERTLEGWTDDDWKEFQAAWIDFIK